VAHRRKLLSELVLYGIIHGERLIVLPRSPFIESEVMQMAVTNSFAGHNALSAKRMNRSIILQGLLKWGALSRVELSKRTDLTQGTITNIVAELRERNVVAETEVDQKTVENVGRSAILVDIISSVAYVAAVHISATQVSVALVDVKGGVGSTIHFPISGHSEQMLNRIGEAIQALREEKPQANVIGVGVGAVGLVDFVQGVNRFAPHIDWVNVPIQTGIQARCNLPVRVDNNVRVMALGEKMFGTAKDVNNLIFVYVGTGLGSGILLDGNVYRGTHNTTGELGHVTVDPLGLSCWCGNRGCLELYVSERALRRAIATKNFDVDADIEEKRWSDAKYDTLMEERGAMLGITLANMHNLFDPEEIILGGRVSENDQFVTAVRREIQQRSFGGRLHEVCVKRTTFGVDLGLIGAASLALQEFFYSWPDDLSLH